MDRGQVERGSWKTISIIHGKEDHLGEQVMLGERAMHSGLLMPTEIHVKGMSPCK